MLFTLISRLAMYRSLFSLAESFTDNVIRGTVDEPARGGIVWCALAGGYVTHSGIYTGNTRNINQPDGTRAKLDANFLHFAGTGFHIADRTDIPLENGIA